MLKAYKLTGRERYFEAAKHWADIFAEKCNFDPEFSPWDRYVDPSVVGWSDKLTGSTSMILEFIDEVIDTGYTGENGILLRAREAGRAYLRNVLLPMWTKNEVWGRQYWDWDNPVMCGAVSMSGDYILERRDAFPNWKNDMRNVLTLILCRNGADPNSMGDTYSGAWAFPESCTCCGTSLSYNQYTAAPTLLRYAMLTGDERIREIGRRMMIMATYDSAENGVVKDGPLRRSCRDRRVVQLGPPLAALPGNGRDGLDAGNLRAGPGEPHHAHHLRRRLGDLRRRQDRVHHLRCAAGNDRRPALGVSADENHRRREGAAGTSQTWRATDSPPKPWMAGTT